MSPDVTVTPSCVKAHVNCVILSRFAARKRHLTIRIQFYIILISNILQLFRVTGTPNALSMAKRQQSEQEDRLSSAEKEQGNVRSKDHEPDIIDIRNLVTAG